MLSMAKGVRLGIMCSTTKRRRNSNYYYYDDDDDDESSRQGLKKKKNDDDDGNLLKKLGSFRLRKCSSTHNFKDTQMDRSKERRKHSRVKRQLENGDRVNLSKILFTKNRDYLITYNHRDRPSISCYESKVHSIQEYIQNMKKVGWLIHKYLREIAPCQNLKISRFFGVAESLTDCARDCFDGVYIAVDIYLEELWQIINFA